MAGSWEEKWERMWGMEMERKWGKVSGQMWGKRLGHMSETKSGLAWGEPWEKRWELWVSRINSGHSSEYPWEHCSEDMLTGMMSG